MDRGQQACFHEGEQVVHKVFGGLLVVHRLGGALVGHQPDGAQRPGRASSARGRAGLWVMGWLVMSVVVVLREVA